MRRKKKRSRLAPFAAGTVVGAAVILAFSVCAALLLSFAGASSGGAGAASLAAIAAGSFFAGRTAGTMRRRGGLKTGALCGGIIWAILVLLSLVFGRGGWVMLLVKLLVCACFGAAGGVAGVNREPQ